MKTDILAIGAHPDDVELGCSGTLMKHIDLGCKVAILDLTEGELGTRGTVEERYNEAKAACKVMGIAYRNNLQFKDGFFQNDETHQLKLIQYIRKYQPDMVLTNSPSDRHPDHGKAAELTIDACFFSGLPKIETELNGIKQSAWRPRVVYHYIQAYYHEPDFVVDISDYMDKKMEAIRAFRSQFFNAESKEPETFISRPEFMEMVYARATEFGVNAGYRYGEGFIANRYLGVEDLRRLK